MAQKTIIRLTESDIQEMVKDVLREAKNSQRKLRSDEMKLTMPSLFSDDPEFDNTEVKITRKKRVSPQEKAKRKEAKKEEKRELKQQEQNKKDADWYKAWEKKGIKQAPMFPEDK